MLVLVRHGESVGNRDHIWCGSSESPLSDTGIIQAKETGQELRDIDFDRVFASPLSRAYDTCRYIIAANSRMENTPIHVRRELIERSDGILEGKPYQETINLLPRRKWLEWERNYYVAPPGGESLAQVSDRVVPFLRDEVYPLLAAGQNVLIGYINGMEEGEVCSLSVEHALPYQFNQIPNISQS
jgi:2,3-bisphosphoglycerate-dependent phosphoglycerate mutase